jgi:ppGpp synthetase/RelA/SpoT-type nucleotidyltranferase
VREELFLAEYVSTKDTREEADHLGYRAVHVIVTDGRLAEIQIRTIWQNAWAQVVESFNDDAVKGCVSSRPE